MCVDVVAECDRYVGERWDVLGLGLVVRQPRQLQFFAAPDLLAMSSMSAVRVGWMAAVARGGTHRACSGGRHPCEAKPTGKRRRQRGSEV